MKGSKEKLVKSCFKDIVVRDRGTHLVIHNRTPHPARVGQRRIPRSIAVVRKTDLETYQAMSDELNRFLSPEDFPHDLFGDGGVVDSTLTLANWEANTTAPSGETGISHLIKGPLFDL
ncbi:hypothetical protein M231_04066 [Tremella mesenterica]|uniref:Uncharacterized protein n=1 Tax=Tremella mesenterica TaxID=5217 RepID=A0A4Q1BLI4_TREME|nr:hypothetical protein M231_04066 [Tremella mesenterica]